ncbi:MAG: hypothetical protein CMF48_03675 [Legionellales bacterium]|nr:hypothetical protein [Legionellales bacterium]
MADQLDFFVHGLRFGEGANAYVLPIMASCAQLRDLVVAAPSLTSRMDPCHQEAWATLQESQGMVTLEANDLARFKKVFGEKCAELTNLPQDATAEARESLHAEIKKIITDAKKALQAQIEQLYTSIYEDMDRHHLPFPEMIPLKAYKAADKKLLDKLYDNKKVKEELPAWATGIEIAGAHTAILNYKKAKKNWLQKLSEWGWLIDSAAVAIGAGVLAGLGAMTPVGWAIAGALLLTTFVDKWQGIDSKGTRLLDWIRRTWHGDYHNRDAVRQPNWKSWKPWVALGVTGLILFSAGAAAYKMFISAMKLTHAIFATIYAVCATSFTLSSLFGGFNKALKEIDMTLWFDKIREYRPCEEAKVADKIAAVAHKANHTAVFDEADLLAHQNSLLAQRVASMHALLSAAEEERASLDLIEEVSSGAANDDGDVFLPACDGGLSTSLRATPELASQPEQVENSELEDDVANRSKETSEKSEIHTCCGGGRPR